MKILRIECYNENLIGEIPIEHVKNEKCFYYNFKKEALENEQDPRGDVIIMQKNKIGNSYQIAIGIYETLEINGNDSSNGLLKISQIKEINSKYYKKVVEIIKERELNLPNSRFNYNLKNIDITNEDYNELKQLLVDSINNKEEEKCSQEIFDSYEKFEGNLCKLAQKSKYAERIMNKKGQRKNRTEYQRDWERIIHSKAFRRLEDKAQIYTLAKGDHFRTRLTHTLEVTQIARGLARELNLNEDLVEAIALGHDLGHTPFGHVGERTLHDILQKDENIDNPGGFKHNYQGVKVVNYLEEKYGEFEGIDLTYQVMEGILKHTKTCGCKNRDNCKYGKDTCISCEENSYVIEEFLYRGDVEKLYPKFNFSTTLEGQVVAVADEIAQRAHDLDDGIASGMININEFFENLKEDSNFDELRQKIDESLDYIRDDKRNYIDVIDIKRARIVSDVITYFIAKVVESSTANIEEYTKYMEQEKGEISKLDKLVIKKKIICFDEKTEKVREKLEDMTSNKIINSEEVNCFDGKGAYIIRKLYNAYCTNPRQMPTTTLKRIYREISKYTNNAVDITNGERELVNKEIDIYNGKDVDNEVKKLKHKIFVRCIIDLIAGMTDDFANKQFTKLYSPRIY